MLNCHGKCERMAAELVGNVVSAEVEGAVSASIRVHVGRHRTVVAGCRRIVVGFCEWGRRQARLCFWTFRRCLYRCSRSYTAVPVPVHMSETSFSCLLSAVGSVTCLLFSPRSCSVRPRGPAVCARVRGALVKLMLGHDATVHGLLVTEAMEQIGDDLVHLW